MDHADNDSKTSTGLLDHAIEVMTANEKFLLTKAKEAFEEVVELMNDAIDNFGLGVANPVSVKEASKRSMAFFAHHVLMPFSYAMYTELLTGNLPACFMELRLMVESLAKCYLADSRYPNQAFFWRGLSCWSKN